MKTNDQARPQSEVASIRLTHGVWRSRASLPDFPSRCAALLNACPSEAVVGGFAAARLHELWLPGTLSNRIEVIRPCDPHRPPGVSGSRRKELRLRRRALHPDEVVIVEGIPTTSEARTWLDLSEVLSLPDLVAAGDSALRGGATLDEIDRVIGRAGRRRGVVRARAARPLLNARSRSRPESHLRVALIAAGLPEPAVNEPILTADHEWLAEPDLYYRYARLALEYNGAGHARPPRMRRDITRELDIEDHEWRVQVFGPAEVFRRPDQVGARVRRLLNERDPGWRARGPFLPFPSGLQ